MPNYSLRTQGHNIMRMHGSKLSSELGRHWAAAYVIHKKTFIDQ
jgi:hypothetical protein